MLKFSLIKIRKISLIMTGSQPSCGTQTHSWGGASPTVCHTSLNVTQSTVRGNLLVLFLKAGKHSKTQHKAHMPNIFLFHHHSLNSIHFSREVIIQLSLLFQCKTAGCIFKGYHRDFVVLNTYTKPLLCPSIPACTRLIHEEIKCWTQMVDILHPQQLTLRCDYQQCTLYDNIKSCYFHMENK